MKRLTNIIQEDFKLKNKGNIVSKTVNVEYTCRPATYKELRAIVKERLAEDKDANLNDIDVSKVTNMLSQNEDGRYGLFIGLDPHNIDASEWDISKVTDISCMFWRCKNFNCDLSKWDVSNISQSKMNMAFSGCDSLQKKPIWYVG